MLTNEDIKKFKEVLSTKEDFGQLGTQMDQNFARVDQNFAKMVTLEEFDQFKVEIKQNIDGLREWFQQIAEKLGMKLEY